IVMTENATHHLKNHFGEKRVKGDIRELVIGPCRTVGRPIFFSVMIMLLSFIPVFMLSGREGKLFHPLAFTKSFAMIGVALISVTLVPALIPTFIKGKLRREEDNIIVRSFINIYKPLLTWALPRRNLVMWMFAALLILAAGMFPLQAIIGLGTSETAWRTMFFITLFFVTGLTVVLTRGLVWQVLAFATLVLLSLWAYHFPKIGETFMPPLDEGTTLDMPSSVPRVSVTQAADDLKHRDGLLRGFPEVESVIGKAGPADTPTHPAPLDMFETIVNFRPKALWPKRVLKFNDAVVQTRLVLGVLEQNGFVLHAPHEDDRDDLINDATQKALERFDETMRELALVRYREFETELAPVLTKFVVAETIRRFDKAGDLVWPKGIKKDREIKELVTELEPDFGPWLVKQPALEDVTRITQQVAQHIADIKAFRTWFQLSESILKDLGKQGMPEDVVTRLEKLKDKKWNQEAEFLSALNTVLTGQELASYQSKLVQRARTMLAPGDALALKENLLAEAWTAVQEILG